METRKCSFDTLKRFISPDDDSDKIAINGIVMIPFKGEEKEFVILNIGKLSDGTTYMDIMSKELLLTNIKWKATLDQYYNIRESLFLNYIRSDIIDVLNDQLKYFPDIIQSAVIDREVSCLDTMSTITGKKTYKTVNIGKVWIPSIYEVFGQVDCNYDDDPINKQYEYFKNEENRKIGNTGWWLRSTYAFYYKNACFVDFDGSYSDRVADTSYSSVLCLRLKLLYS